MDITLLPSSTGPDPAYQFLSTYLFDGVLAVDAGSLGFWGDLAGQGRVRDIVLTHTHIDHVASLPVFMENVYGLGPAPVVHATAPVLDCLRTDIFNGRLFPDLLSRVPENGPFAVFKELTPGHPRALGTHTVTAVPVNHPVPTVAVLVERGDSAVLIATDTGPTDAVWAFAAGVKNLKAVLLEATFHDDFRWLADISGHLTSAQFAGEQTKAPPGIPRLAIHMKAKSRDAVRREITARNLPGVEVMEPGKTYQF